RVIASSRIVSLEQESLSNPLGPASEQAGESTIFVVVDRLTAGNISPERLRDSVETAFSHGADRCQVFIQDDGSVDLNSTGGIAGHPYTLDGSSWRRVGYSARLRCDDCERDYPELEPRLF